MKKKPFTLLELLTAMTVFTIFMLAVMRFFGLSQDVMSSSTNNVGQYEKVRVVMDMIASDLQNIYYNEGVATIVYYQQNNNASFKSLDIPVQKSQKIGKSDVALARVHYSLNNDIVNSTDTGLKKLQMLAIGNKDSNGVAEGGWALHKYSLTPTLVFPALSSTNNLSTILDGVVDMKITTYNRGTAVAVGAYSSTAEGNVRIPDYVIVEIKMVDDNVLKMVREKTAMGIDVNLTGDEYRLFSRRIDIDRGQSF